MSRLRHPFRRGTFEAHAILIDTALVGEDEAKRRVIAAWNGGAVFRLGDGYLVYLRAEQRLRAEEAPGTVMVLHRGILTAAPLEDDEWKQVAPSPNSVLLVREGHIESRAVSDLAVVDASEFLDVSAFRLQHARTLGNPPVLARVVEPPPSPSVRGVISAVGPSDPGMIQLAQTLRALGSSPQQSLPTNVRAAFAEAGKGAALATMGAMLSPLARLLARLSRSNASARPRGESSTRSGALASGGVAAGVVSAAALAGLAASGALGIAPLAVLGAALGAGILTGALVTASRAKSVPDGAESTGSELAVREQPAGGPSWISHALDRLQNLIARGLLATKLAPFVGARQAAYLRHMFDLFETGDLREALRHAIPLGGEGEAEGSSRLWAPKPRAELEILSGPGGAASVNLHDELYARLQAHYEKALEKLEVEGRYEEAAFVLAELLRDGPRAIALLERHDKKALAAEIAEALKLSDDVVVRQWLVAGNVARAVAYARRKQCSFAALVETLERRNDTVLAQTLRLSWADLLASTGHWVGAVEALWPVTEARHLAAPWLENARALGDDFEARVLPYAIEIHPDRFGELVARVCELSTSAHPPEVRLRLAESMVGRLDKPGVPLEALRVVARPLVRGLLRDSQREPEKNRMSTMETLAAYFGDAALRADLPKSLTPLPSASLLGSGGARTHTSHPVERGTMPVHDAVLLPRGRVLLALGEAGVRLVGARGQTLAHFPVPAEHIVLSTHADRALLLARCGKAWAISRLDLLGRRVERWCEVALGCWVRSFDGERWFVSHGDALVAVDVTQQSFVALQKLKGLGTAVALDWVNDHLIAILSSGSAQKSEALERIDLETKGWILRSRKELQGMASPDQLPHLKVAVTEGGVAFVGTGTPPKLTVHNAGTVVSHPLFGGLPTEGIPTSLAVSSRWFACGLREPHSLGTHETLEVLDRTRLQGGLTLQVAGTNVNFGAPAASPARLTVEARGTVVLGMRLQERPGTPTTLVITTEDGRVLGYELERGDLVACVRS